MLRPPARQKLRRQIFLERQVCELVTARTFLKQPAAMTRCHKEGFQQRRFAALRKHRFQNTPHPGLIQARTSLPALVHLKRQV